MPIDEETKLIIEEEALQRFQSDGSFIERTKVKRLCAQSFIEGSEFYHDLIAKDQKWINIKDRQPEVGEEVICWNDLDKVVEILNWAGKYFIYDNAMVNIHITHWSLLPRPPKNN